MNNKKMKINILIPYKEKFDLNKASSVSITIRNNLFYSKFLTNIKIYGQEIENPMFKDNFVGLKYSILSLKSKNEFLLNEMLKKISHDSKKKHLIEIHNRPYLVKKVPVKNKFPISLFFHNDPQTMQGSRSVKEREYILKKCAAIFCVSNYIKKQFLQGLKPNSKKIHVLYNGVDRKIKKFPKKKKEILFVGRLVSEKGVELYVNVVKSIASSFPDWSFGMIGSPNQSKKSIHFANTIINRFSSVGSQVKFFGSRDYDFVQKKMQSASIIVIPSLWEEPFGLVAAEAMSNGIAIVGSKVGGIPEIVKENGILIDNINQFKLSKTLIGLINDKKRRELLQKKSWENFNLSSEKSSKRLDYFRNIIIKKYF